MYCTECKCEFMGWSGSCPVCGGHPTEGPPSAAIIMDKAMSYEELVGLVGERGGPLAIDLSAIDVGTERTWSFPYFGYGWAWAKRMQGESDGVWADLQTLEVGKRLKSGFPYVGYRFGWAKLMEGSIAGNEVSLAAEKVVFQRKWAFPFFGYGFAWTQEMSGECGPDLKASLVTTEVGRTRRSRFPYRGYGFAWAKRATLTVELAGM